MTRISGLEHPVRLSGYPDATGAMIVHTMMMDLVRKLEGRTDEERRLILIHEILRREWSVRLQEYSFAEQQGTNIIVDLQENAAPEILLVAHYDTFHGSPGANDDASALAVLLDCGDRLIHSGLFYTIRIIFFDDEEPTPHWNFPVGSTMYVNEFGVQNILGVIDLELCGMGDAVGIWPVNGAEESDLLRKILFAAGECGIPNDFGMQVPGFYGDYLPFRQAGLKESICLTAFHWKERNKVLRFGDSSITRMAFRYFLWRTFHLPTVPTVFQHYHNNTDRSEFLSENTLEMMSELVYQTVLQF